MHVIERFNSYPILGSMYRAYSLKKDAYQYHKSSKDKKAVDKKVREAYGKPHFLAAYSRANAILARHLNEPLALARSSQAAGKLFPYIGAIMRGCFLRTSTGRRGKRPRGT